MPYHIAKFDVADYYIISHSLLFMLYLSTRIRHRDLNDGTLPFRAPGSKVTMLRGAKLELSRTSHRVLEWNIMYLPFQFYDNRVVVLWQRLLNSDQIDFNGHTRSVPEV